MRISHIISLTDKTHLLKGRKGGAELSKIGKETLTTKKVYTDIKKIKNSAGFRS